MSPRNFEYRVPQAIPREPYVTAEMERPLLSCIPMEAQGTPSRILVL